MPTEPPAIRAVLFDLDDTLNDRCRSWLVFVELIARPDGGYLSPCRTADVHRAIIAADRGGYRPKHELFADLQRLLPWRVPRTAAEIEQIWRNHFPSCTVTREPAGRLLARLRDRGIRTAVVTNGRGDAQRAKLARMGLVPLLDTVVISEELGAKKPDPRIFRAALERLNVGPGQALFVGDDPERDVVAALEAGLVTAWLANGREWSLRHAAPHHVLGDLADLEEVLAAVAPGWA